MRGINTKAQLADTEAVLQQRLRKAALDAGVTMIAPDTVFLSADTKIASDVTIEPYVVIGPRGGASRVRPGSACRGRRAKSGTPARCRRRQRPGRRRGRFPRPDLASGSHERGRAPFAARPRDRAGRRGYLHLCPGAGPAGVVLPLGIARWCWRRARWSGRSRPGSVSWTAGSPRGWYSPSMPAATRCGARSSWTTGRTTTACGSAAPRPGRSRRRRPAPRSVWLGGSVSRSAAQYPGKPRWPPRPRTATWRRTRARERRGRLRAGLLRVRGRGASVLLTLLRAVGQLSRDDLPTRAGHAGWPTAVPDAQCLGPERLQFGVTLDVPRPVSGRPRPCLGRSLSAAPRPVDPPVARARAEPRVAFSFTATAWCFPPSSPRSDGRGVVIRCYNPGDRPARGSVAFGAPARAAVRVERRRARMRTGACSPPIGAGAGLVGRRARS